MAELKELHFRIGEDFGKLLMQIAQEHLLYNYNVQKALNTLSDLPYELQLKVLKGDYIIDVDEESQQLLVSQREEGIDPRFQATIDEFPRIDIKNWYERNIKEIISSGNGLKKAIEQMMINMKYKKPYRTYDYQMIIEFITTGDSQHIIDDLMESEEISQLALLIDVTKRYIEKSMKIIAVIDWMKKTYPEEFEAILDLNKHNEILQLVVRKFSELMKCDLSEVQKQSEALDNYIEASQEIDKVLSEGIQPVDILDNYGAGWLSPEGEYYALNGEIANMLHIQIANALQEKGLIPMYENDRDKEVGIETNPDAWLEQQGWVKIHGNNVQFAGNLNNRFGKPIVHLTDKQIEIIRDYITDCHQCEIKAGWRLERTSIGLFTSLAMADKMSLYKKYFDF